MLRLRVPDCKLLSSYNMSVMATEYMHMLKLLGNRACGGYQESVQNLDMEDVDFDKMSLDAQESGISDDDIEDW